jgi:hypothetical protein
MLRSSREFAETAGGSRRHSTSSSSSKTIPAASTFGRAVFVPLKTARSSNYFPSRSLHETLNAQSSTTAPALSMLSVVSDKRAPSNCSSTFNAIDEAAVI